MARIAYIEEGKVVNVVKGDQAYADATGGVVGPESVSPGWSFDGASFAPPPLPVTGPQRIGLTRGQFRLLFTFEERQGEAAFKRAAEAAAADGTATNEHLVYLTMRDDFDNAGSINLTDPATVAALDFYEAFGLLSAERKARVLAGEPPA